MSRDDSNMSSSHQKTEVISRDGSDASISHQKTEVISCDSSHGSSSHPKTEVISRDGSDASISHQKTALLQSAADADGEASLVGRIIDERYEVVRRLGEGAMGEVYEARHLHLDKSCALKVIHDHVSADKGLAERFKREAKTCSALEHPNCIGVTDFGQLAPGRFYLVMEYVKGQTLTQLLDAGLIDRKTAFEVTRQILLGLEHAHEAGIVHRDIKLDNVMKVERSDGAWQIKILDFGLAKALGMDAPDAKLTRTGLVVGTPNYMAPEQIADREVDGRADLYAAGILLFRMLIGRPIFPGDTPVEVVQAKLRGPAPSLKKMAPEHYTPSLSAFLERVLKRNPKERFADAREMREELERIIAEEETAGTAWAFFGRWYRCVGGEASPRRRLFALVTTRDGAFVLGALVAAGLAVSLLGVMGVKALSADRASESMVFVLGEVPEEPAFLKDRFMEIQVLLEKGECAKALESYEEVRVDASSVAKGRYLEGRASACLDKTEEALRAYGGAIDLDSGYRHDPRILDLAKELLRKPKTRDAAMDFLRDKLGEAALPTLIEMAGHDPNKKLREQARQAVAKLGAKDRIDRVPALELDLRQARGCKEKKQIVSRLAQTGGPEAKAALRRARDAQVKDGFFSKRYLHDCVRRDIIEALKTMPAQ